VEALGRRARPQPRTTEAIKVGEFEIDLDRRTVLRAGGGAGAAGLLLAACGGQAGSPAAQPEKVTDVGLSAITGGGPTTRVTGRLTGLLLATGESTGTVAV